MGTEDGNVIYFTDTMAVMTRNYYANWARSVKLIHGQGTKVLFATNPQLSNKRWRAITGCHK